ncbi:hypothetical protein [Chamaesiphon sp.]
MSIPVLAAIDRDYHIQILSTHSRNNQSPSTIHHPPSTIHHSPFTIHLLP